MTRKNATAPITMDDIARDCLAVRLRLINRAVSRIYDQALRPFGVRVSQMNILVAITQFDQARQQDICRVLSLERSTLSRDVDRMRAKGWVESSTGDDARTNLLRLTSSGKRLLEKVVPAWDEAQQQAVALLGEDVAVALGQIVTTLRRQTLSSED